MSVQERVGAGRWLPPLAPPSASGPYDWAAKFCRNARVLDAACANAYGSNTLLRRGAAGVVSLDIDPGTLQEATMSRKQPHLSLLAGDATGLPFGDAAFDVFVSFETMEHVRDDVAYVREARRVVRAGGLFVCSTPNRKMTNPGTTIEQTPFNKFHLREYTLPELTARLRADFRTIDWFGQSFFSKRYGDALASIGSRSPTNAVRLHQIRKVAGALFDMPERHWPAPLDGTGEPEVLLAVCR